MDSHIDPILYRTGCTFKDKDTQTEETMQSNAMTNATENVLLKVQAGSVFPTQMCLMGFFLMFYIHINFTE